MTYAGFESQIQRLALESAIWQVEASIAQLKTDLLSKETKLKQLQANLLLWKQASPSVAPSADLPKQIVHDGGDNDLLSDLPHDLLNDVSSVTTKDHDFEIIEAHQVGTQANTLLA